MDLTKMVLPDDSTDVLFVRVIWKRAFLCLLQALHHPFRADIFDKSKIFLKNYKKYLPVPYHKK